MINSSPTNNEMDGSPEAVNLRRNVAALLDHTVSIDVFHDWFFSVLWDIEQSASDDDVSLAATIENRLAEYTGGHISAEALRGALLDDTREMLATSSTGRVSA